MNHTVSLDLPVGFGVEFEEDFVYLIHAGERTARFSVIGTTAWSIETEARIQSDALAASSQLRYTEEKCLYEHLHDLFDEAGLSAERRTYWDALIEDAAAREFGECTECLEEYAAENFAEFLSDPAVWIGGTDGVTDVIETGWSR